MPIQRIWTGPDIQLHCPNCHHVWLIALHPGLEVCPHDDQRARGECEKCQRDALAGGEVLKAPVPPPMPGPPPPPSAAFAHTGRSYEEPSNVPIWNRPFPTLDPNHEEELKATLRDFDRTHAEIPPRFDPSGGENG